MPGQSLVTIVTHKESSLREQKTALRDELVKRLATCGDSQAASIGKVLDKVMDDIAALPDPDEKVKTAAELEADEVAAARAARAAKKASGEVVGRKRATK